MPTLLPCSTETSIWPGASCPSLNLFSELWPSYLEIVFKGVMNVVACWQHSVNLTILGA